MNLKLIIAILLPVLVGAVSGFATSANIPGWYATLNKPWFNPPNWIFGPVWTTLYVLMGYASYLIYQSEHARKKQALTLYAIQLVLNFFWSIIFFHFKQLPLALAEIALLWIAINLTIVSFSKINKTAAYLMLPYVAWVSFASILNYYVMVLN